MSDRRVAIGRAGPTLRRLQADAERAQRDLQIAFAVLVQANNLPDATRLVAVEGETVIVDVPE